MCLLQWFGGCAALCTARVSACVRSVKFPGLLLMIVNDRWKLALYG
jgi:hypothetical protein